ncbi:hypothetical protein CDAR_458271 [Caerostris darwini]|uniref:Uncharacterized protein n=1 Tax=Caerostris darwini TaxID=1538125 RepID=A0AAV4TSK9_9ARAC|nr:hypothetical protein CDAR_458271 [Caerostris darwini]
MHARVSTAPRYYNNSWRRKQEKRQDEKKKTGKTFGANYFPLRFSDKQRAAVLEDFAFSLSSLIRSFSGKSANTASSRFSGFPSRSIDSGHMEKLLPGGGQSGGGGKKSSEGDLQVLSSVIGGDFVSSSRSFRGKEGGLRQILRGKGLSMHIWGFK